MSTTTLPAYNANHINSSMSLDEKNNTFCPTHGPSLTPQIDTQLQKPAHRNQLLALSKALSDLAETGCTRCATESILRTSSAVLADLHRQKKNGEFSKEQKKALKQEGKLFKAFLKPLKKEMKASFREQK